MKLHLIACISLLTCQFVLAEPVTVYDIDVEPDSPNKKVTVTYRLAPTDSGIANVDVEISDDAGDTWTVPSESFYPGSDVGPGVRADGTLRQLVWDARADWNHQYSTQMMVKLSATTTESGSWVYLNAGSSLYRMRPDGSDFHAVIEHGYGFDAYLFGAANQTIYFSSWGSGAPIYAYDTQTGGNIALLHSGPGNGGQGMAFDEQTSTFFLGRYYNGLYSLDEQHSSTWQQIVTPSDISPMIGVRGQIDIDRTNQHVYFRGAYNGFCDNCRYIWRVGYDGQGLQQIIKANGGDGLALDLDSGHMYYTDGEDEDQDTNVRISRANLDGSNPETLLILTPPYEFCRNIALDTEGGYIYMSLMIPGDWTEKAIARSRLDGTEFEILKELPRSTYGKEGGIVFMP